MKRLPMEVSRKAIKVLQRDDDDQYRSVGEAEQEEQVNTEDEDNSLDLHVGESVELQQQEQSHVESENEKSKQDFEQDEPVYPKSKKKHTPGIVYLSYIPEGLTVAKTRELLGEFGNIGRIYFEPVKKLNKKTRPNHRFVEGWVEFQKKKVAKRVAEVLNTKPVGGKRKAPYHDALWSIKYLHRFRWTHLSERLAYEKAVKDQRLRTEIAQAKREASYYAKALERSIRLKKRRKLGEVVDESPSNIKLKQTDREIRQQKPEHATGDVIDRSLLLNIFPKR